MNDIERSVWEALKKVKDPELRKSVIDLGLIRKIEEKNGIVQIDFALETPFCPFLNFLVLAMKKAAEKVDGVKEVKVKVIVPKLGT